MLWKRLQRRQFHGLKFRRQYGVGKFVLDFYCPHIRLAIEVDDRTHFTPERQIYDQSRDAYLRSRNITVVRFLSTDVLFDSESVMSALEHKVLYHPVRR